MAGTGAAAGGRVLSAPPAFAPAPARLPPGRRVYAVGDVHGCAARLAALHRQVAADLDARPAASALLIHLGDYVDKGEDGAGVLQLLADGPAVPGAEVRNLGGNHEEAMRLALAGEPGDVADWLWCGGRPTLNSYGLSPDASPAAWRAGIPAAHLRVLGALGRSHREGGYLFVHAGVRPGVPIGQQLPDDLIRIRQPFLSSAADHGAVVVHGHTARPEPEVHANRINIDTAAWSGGPLTCAVLEEDRIGFLFG